MENYKPRSPEEILAEAQRKLDEHNALLVNYLKEMRDVDQKTIDEQTDPRTKYVGDKVVIWDRSWATYEDGKLCKDIVNDHECIVTAVNQNYKTVCTFGNPNTCDLIVWSPKLNKLIYTLSICVKLTDNEKI